MRNNMRNDNGSSGNDAGTLRAGATRDILAMERTLPSKSDEPDGPVAWTISETMASETPPSGQVGRSEKRVYLVRHCRAEGAGPGATLCEEGARQADALADWFAGQ